MKPLEIGIVAHELEGDRTGVGRYLEGLLQGLMEIPECPHRFRLFFKGDPFSRPPFFEGDGGDSPFEAVFDRRPHTHPVFWEQGRLPFLVRRHEVDFLFSPAYSLPLLGPAGLPSMLTIHDLSFEHRGEEFGRKERWRRRFLARWGARRASRVLADASEIADEIAARYAVARDKIGVLPLAVDARFNAPSHPRTDLELLRAAGITPPFLLHVGAILPRRRIDLAIAAFVAVAAERPDLSLVLAGPDRLPRAGELESLITASGMPERVVRPGYVGEATLLALYRRAALLFYLSAYEGFGLPPLEALAAGTLPVVGHAPGLAELWPEYPHRCGHLDREEVIAAVREILDSDGATLAEARRRIATLTWRRSAELFLTEVARAIGNGGRA